MRDRLDRIVTSMASGLALVGAAGVIIMLLHITAYVVMRTVFGRPIPATVETVSSYYMVLVAFLPIAWAERRGEMITIEVFAGLFPALMKRFVAVFVALVTLTAYAVLTWATWRIAMREFTAGSFVISLNVPVRIWPGYFFLPAGFGVATLVALYQFIDLLLPARARPADGARPGEPA